MAGKKARGRPKKQQIKVDDKIPKLNTIGRNSAVVMESIFGASKMQARSVNLPQMSYGEASGSASQQQKKANQSPIPMHVDLRAVTIPLPEDPKESIWAGVLTGNRSTANVDFGSEFLIEIPLWVRFPKLPMNCWSGNSLSRIVSTIGISMFADEYTAKQSRISFTRSLIEINITKPLPRRLPVMDDSGAIFEQAVEYDWKPEFCERCLKVGHDCAKIPKEGVNQDQQPKKRRPPPVKQIWKTKETTVASTSEESQKQVEESSKEVECTSEQPENMEDKQQAEEGPKRQLEKGKIAVGINGVPMTYAKAILSPMKQGPQQQTSLDVMLT
ncbi:hypothetical protein A4A49_08417 [Nicotiana attenuata]|uniref:Uncharacterized protein n=1 Tax=Nicotiana attenuata TaxID=49451 RepID=A0A314KUF0_NICAT|nr:hypothetical protein A4A49_08417 [Nicotiana attenuata]